MFSIFSKHIIRRISMTHMAMASKRFKFTPKDNLVWVDLEVYLATLLNFPLLSPRPGSLHLCA